MLWAERAGIDRKTLTLVTCDRYDAIAAKYVPAGEDRPRKAIQAARAWVIDDGGRE